MERRSDEHPPSEGPWSGFENDRRPAPPEYRRGGAHKERSRFFGVDSCELAAWAVCGARGVRNGPSGVGGEAIGVDHR